MKNTDQGWADTELEVYLDLIKPLSNCTTLLSLIGFVNFSIAFFRVIIREKYMDAEIAFVSSALKNPFVGIYVAWFPNDIICCRKDFTCSVLT